jgi:Domain of unknown function (DUF4192)
LAALPYQLGYHPQDSIVVMALRDGAVDMVERLDLPAASDASDAAGALVAPLVREGFDSVLLIGFESSAEAATPVMGALSSCLTHHRIRVLDQLVVRDGRWFRPDCATGCCPREGMPVPEAAATPAVADYVGLGVAPLPRRADLAEAVRADLDISELVSVELRRLESASQPPSTSMQRLAWLSLWAAVCREPVDQLVDEICGPPEVAELARSLGDAEFRDAIVAWLCPGSLPLAAIDEDLVDALLSTLGPLPAEGRSIEAARTGRRLLVRLEWLARAVPDPHATPLLTVLASLAWHLGDGSLARVALDRALAQDQDYRLAILLDRMIDLGVRPGGVEVRQSRRPARAHRSSSSRTVGDAGGTGSYDA